LHKLRLLDLGLGFLLLDGLSELGRRCNFIIVDCCCFNGKSLRLINIFGSLLRLLNRLGLSVRLRLLGKSNRCLRKWLNLIRIETRCLNSI
jgi:hypothetical protein